MTAIAHALAMDPKAMLFDEVILERTGTFLRKVFE